MLVNRSVQQWDNSLSLSPTCLVDLDDLFPKFRRLSTMDLSYSNIEHLPDSIKYLENLHYLGLNHTNITALPPTISCLVNLQIFEARDCSNLSELPPSIKELTKLRHLDVTKESSYVGMPLGIGQLTNLQTLATYNVGGDFLHCTIGELKSLEYLRGCLEISGLENVKIADEAMEADLKSKKYLEILKFKWCGLRGYIEDDGNATTAEENLENLKPCNNLRELAISNYMGSRFPLWMQDPSFSNLASVTLKSCANCSMFPSLGDLPSLRFLSVRKMYSVQRIGDTSSSFGTKNASKFPSLEVLSLWEMYDLEELVKVRDGDFPRLHNLSISMCPNLTNLPTLPSLVELSLHCCEALLHIPDLPSLEYLKIEDFENIKSLHLPPKLPVLKKLEISHCNELMSVEGLSCLTSIEKLKVVQCPKLDSLKTWNSDGFMKENPMRKDDQGSILVTSNSEEKEKEKLGKVEKDGEGRSRKHNEEISVEYSITSTEEPSIASTTRNIPIKFETTIVSENQEKDNELSGGFDIEELLIEAQARWLKPSEVLCILKNHKKFRTAPEPPTRPASGSLFLINRRVVRYFRKDGHSWRRKKDGKTVVEAHERLKVKNVDVLNCYYARGEDNGYFQRRCYWMLDPAYSHIVLVHYLEVSKQLAFTGSMSNLSTAPSTSNQGCSVSEASSHASIIQTIKSENQRGISSSAELIDLEEDDDYINLKHEAHDESDTSVIIV